MKNILHDLYNGRFCVWEHRPIRTAENIATNRKIEEEKRYFMQLIPPDDHRRFEALENLYSDSSAYEQADAFSFGFKFGVMLMLATLMDEDEPQVSE